MPKRIKNQTSGEARDKKKGLAALPLMGSLFRDNKTSATSSPQQTGRVIKSSRDQHLAPNGPKRILALDGGGVRGIIAIAVLERIEQLLRSRHGHDPDFVLSDYFDLIGGTSTGAIIASALAAKQMSAQDIYHLYKELAPKVFQRKIVDAIRRPRAIYAAFDSAILEGELKRVLGTITLGDDRIATGFAAIAKRVDTDSTWVLANHPNGQFHHEPDDGSFIGNKDYPLVRIIRASTAAPFYFPPEKILIARGQRGQKDEIGLFMDGGITMHNNPSLQLLMLAKLEGYRFHWPLGEDNIFMISVGTGNLNSKTSAEKMDRKAQMFKTIDALSSMISGSEDFIEMVMQWVSEPPAPRHMDSEIGAMVGDLIDGKPLLTYQRYNPMLTQDWLAQNLNLKLSDANLKLVRDMTNPKGMDIGYEIGQAVAEKYIREEHFPAQFDIVTEQV